MPATIIDVSKYQGRIEWAVLAASGRVDGAILKATDGQTGVDDTFAANFDGARATSLLLGTYHFAQPDEEPGDAAKEADHYVATVSQRWDRSPLVFALDVEKARHIRKGAPFVAWCRTFVEQMEQRTGLLGWVYTGGPFWNENDGDISDADAEFFAARPLWIAAYVDDPARYVAMTPWRAVGHTLHQWAGDVAPGGKPGIRYPGIAANVVDTNRFGGSLAALRAIIGRPAPDAMRDTLPSPAMPLSRIDDGPATPLRAGEGEHNVPLQAVDFDEVT